MPCCIGIVQRKDVLEYCINNLCILDVWSSASKKYSSVQPGFDAYIYDRANDNLYYNLETISAPQQFTTSPFQFSWGMLDLKIQLQLKGGDIKQKIGGARKLLESAGVTFSNQNPEPRVYDDDVCSKIQDALKDVKSEENQIAKSYVSLLGKDIEKRLTDKEWKLLRSVEDKYSLQESEYGFDGIIGLKNIKNFIKTLINAAKDESKCRDYKLQISRGFFLFGPPGTGKTVFAKAVAFELKAKYFEISPAIIAGFPGEAENVIEIFLRKRFEQFKKEEGKGVIIFDEADALFPDRNKPYMSSVMARIVPTFLRVIDDLLKNQTFRYHPIFLFAISNHPEAIDDAFLRPGRFANLYYVGLPTEEEYKELFKYYLKLREKVVEDAVMKDIDKIINKLQERTKAVRKDGKELHQDFGKFSPADIQEISNSAALKACQENTKITVRIIEDVINNAIPSVINEILIKNEEFKQNHPNTYRA
ncbi:MAG: ATP-binding protein [candidate division WOR-3 bacterium]